MVTRVSERLGVPPDGQGQRAHVPRVCTGTAVPAGEEGRLGSQRFPVVPRLPRAPLFRGAASSTFWQRWRHREPCAGWPAPRHPPGVHLPPSAQATALPLPHGIPAGCHVAPEPRCRSHRRSVPLRVAHLKFQLSGCFRAGGMQNQPANTNKYLLHPPPPSNSHFHSYFPAGFGGGNRFSKLSVNVCNNRKRCLLACGRHSFK